MKRGLTLRRGPFAESHDGGEKYYRQQQRNRNGCHRFTGFAIPGNHVHQMHRG